MKLFKKKVNNCPVSTKETQITNQTHSDELKVEDEACNFIIFVDSKQKYYLCIDNDFENCIPFDSYVIFPNNGAYILKRDNLFALLYYTYSDSNFLDGKWKITDFIFTKVEQDTKNIILYTQDNIKYMYMYKTFISNVLSYSSCYNNYILVKNTDHEELYYIKFGYYLTHMFSAKSIMFSSEYEYASNKIPFIYEEDENQFGYFIAHDYEVIDYSKKYNRYYTSISDEFFNNRSIYILMGTNEHGMKCIFNMFKPDKVSDYYDDIKITNSLFLCRTGNHFDILDMNINICYRYNTDDDINLSLEYDVKQNKYILSDKNNNEIISLYLYECIAGYSKYAIFNKDDEYGIFYDDVRHFTKPNFIRKLDTVYEFEDTYLIENYSYYKFFSKEADIHTISKDVINFQYLSEILYFNKDNTSISLEPKCITLLKKCNVSVIEKLNIEDNSMVIKACTPICDILIKDDKIQYTLLTGEEFLINESDIKTNLVDYILDNIKNKFYHAYLKDGLKD